LPELSRLAAATPTTENPDRAAPAALGARLAEGLARIAFYITPISVSYLVIGDLVVGAILQTGEFDADDTRLVWLVLGGFSLGLIATTSSRLLQNTLYAVGDARTPARAAGVAVAISAVVGAILMLQLDRVLLDGFEGLDHLPSPLRPLPDAIREGGPLRLGAVGLSLAASVSSWVEFFILRRRIRGLGIPVAIGGRQLARVGPASVVVAVVGLGLRPLVDDLPPLLALPLVAGLAAVAYLGVTLALAVPEATALVGRFLPHRR
jgi:putative peptidoglycan lipid II flippase